MLQVLLLHRSMLMQSRPKRVRIPICGANAGRIDCTNIETLKILQKPLPRHALRQIAARWLQFAASYIPCCLWGSGTLKRG